VKWEYVVTEKRGKVKYDQKKKKRERIVLLVSLETVGMKEKRIYLGSRILLNWGT